MWLYRNVHISWTGQRFDTAARGGSTAIVDWILENYPAGSSTALDSVALFTNDYMFYKLQSYCAGFTAVAMDALVAKGGLDSPAWLHNRHGTPCTTAAIDAATANGHIHVVEWLHDNRLLCSRWAAQKNGNLLVVKWIHANRKEGCTPRAVDAATLNDHLNIVECLHLNRGVHPYFYS